MNSTMLTQHDLAIKAGQFVAPTATAQYDAAFEVGRKAYRDGKRRTWCTSGAMQDGWDSAFEDGRQLNARVMLAAEVM